METCSKHTKKIDFDAFGTVLAKMAIKIYNLSEHDDILGHTVKLVREHLWEQSVSPSALKSEQIDNDFDKYRLEYEHARKYLQKERRLFERVFDGYAKASKRGVKIMPLRQFKWMMRDLAMIPHITTEYKCAQLYKFLDTSKCANQDYPEEILTVDVFPLSLYIVFSLVLEEETEIGRKSEFMVKWVREQAKNKLAGVHACREDRRIKFTNEKLMRR